jgi:hypothetical protein
MSISATTRAQQAKELWIQLIIPFAGDPAKVARVSKDWKGMQDKSYKFILISYKNARLVMEIPKELTDTACKELVKKIYSVVVNQSESHQLFRKNSKNPLALVPLIQNANAANRQLQIADEQLEAARTKIEDASAGNRMQRTSGVHASKSFLFDAFTCPSGKKQECLDAQHNRRKNEIKRKLVETAQALSVTKIDYANLPASLYGADLKRHYFK